MVSDYYDASYIKWIELSIAVYFTLEMIGNFYVHPKPKYLYFKQLDTYIDLCTIFPEYLSLFFTSDNSGVQFLRILRVFKIMRIVKFRKTIRNAQRGRRSDEPELNGKNMSRVKKQTIFLTVSLFATLFISAGIVTFIQDIFKDSFSEHLKFHDALYFVVITSTTMGYGDIIPIKHESKICIAIMIIIIFTIFGEQVSRLISIYYESDRYDVKYKFQGHIVVFNNKSLKVLTEFLLDYLNYNVDAKILVVDDVCISDSMK